MSICIWVSPNYFSAIFTLSTYFLSIITPVLFTKQTEEFRTLSAVTGAVFASWCCHWLSDPGVNTPQVSQVITSTISANQRPVSRSRDRSRPITVPELITIRAKSRHHNYSSQHKYLRARVTVSQIDDPGPVSRMRMRAHPGPVANPIMPRPHRPVLQSGENIWLSGSNIIFKKLDNNPTFQLISLLFFIIEVFSPWQALFPCLTK